MPKTRHPAALQRARRAAAMAAPAAAAAAGPLDAAALAALPFPPHAPLAGREAGSFAEGTVKTRLPAIMGTVLSDLARLAATPAFASDADKLVQVEAAAAGVRALQAEMPADAALAPLAAPPGAPPHLVAAAAQTNAAVEAWRRRNEEARAGARARGRAVGAAACAGAAAMSTANAPAAPRAPAGGPLPRVAGPAVAHRGVLPVRAAGGDHAGAARARGDRVRAQRAQHAQHAQRAAAAAV